MSDLATGTSVAIRRTEALTAGERDNLTAVLIACVDGGASLGFHASLAWEKGRRWWEGFPRRGVVLLVAERDGRIVGTVQLHAAESENGAHRAEVAKLLVDPACRRQGIGRALMARLEEEARTEGHTLLVLDTRAGDPSNDLYQALGYIEGGRVPNWARDSTGVLSETVFWYKQLP